MRSDEMKFSKQLANPSQRFSGVLFLSPPAFSPLWFLLLLSPTSSNILLSNFLYGTSQFTLTAWHLHILLMCGKSSPYALWWEAEPTPTSILQKKVMFWHSLQENIGSGHLRHQRCVCVGEDQPRESSCLQTKKRPQYEPQSWFPSPSEMSVYCLGHQAMVFCYGSPNRIILPETWSLCILC